MLTEVTNDQQLLPSWKKNRNGPAEIAGAWSLVYYGGARSTWNLLNASRSKERGVSFDVTPFSFYLTSTLKTLTRERV